MNRFITVEEARSLNVYNRHVFSPTTETYKGNSFYVIEFEKGIKIGITNNLRTRLASYRKPWCQSIKNLRCYKHANPIVLETFIKKRFVRSYGTDATSREFIVGTSFEYLVKFIEKNEFFCP